MSSSASARNGRSGPNFRLSAQRAAYSPRQSDNTEGRRLGQGGLAAQAQRDLAADTVLSSSIAMVIGPTPPGTGVIAPATSRAASKSTSPTRPSSVRFMPTAIPAAPGL